MATGSSGRREERAAEVDAAAQRDEPADERREPPPQAMPVPDIGHGQRHMQLLHRRMGLDG